MSLNPTSNFSRRREEHFNTQTFQQSRKNYESSSKLGQKIADRIYTSSSSESSNDSSSSDSSDDELDEIRASKMFKDFSRWYPVGESPNEMTEKRVITLAIVLSTEPGCPFADISEDYNTCKEKLNMLYQYKMHPGKYHKEIFEFNRQVAKNLKDRNDKSCALL